MPVFSADDVGKTLREFVFQIATIIAGILIALWVDNYTETRHERDAVAHAHDAIRREIADNLVDLEKTLPLLEQHQQGLEAGMRYLDDMSTRGKSDVTFNASVGTPSLNRSSWQTADRTGALGFMDWQAVKDYSEVYSLQDLVVASQTKLMERIPKLMPIMTTPSAGALAGLDLDALRTVMREQIGAIILHRTLAQQLVENYEKY